MEAKNLSLKYYNPCIVSVLLRNAWSSSVNAAVGTAKFCIAWMIDTNIFLVPGIQNCQYEAVRTVVLQISGIRNNTN